MSRDKEVVQRYMERGRKGALEAVRSGLCLLICAACCIGCTKRAEPNELPASPARASVSPSIDRLLMFARDWPREEVELALTRKPGRSTVTLFRPARDGRPRIVLDSIGPGPDDAEEVRAMLNSFDIWAMNAPNAAGAACRTVNGYRNCTATANDYSLVMRVESGGQVRVQRYTHLEASTSSRSARALADFVLAWARKREGRGKRP